MPLLVKFNGQEVRRYNNPLDLQPVMPENLAIVEADISAANTAVSQCQPIKRQ